MDQISHNSAYNIVDYTEEYQAIMQFNKNKTAFIHQWYSFVEGYSKEFICSIIDELDYTPQNALDPFAGSGTTPLELQEIGINCYSFEVSPFMHLLSTVKMRQDYRLPEFAKALRIVITFLQSTEENIRDFVSPPMARTMYEQGKLKKWLFNEQVLDGILDIKYAISHIEDEKYQNLFKIALASILLDVSNVFRNGKCLSYKKNWRNINNYSRKEIHNLFLGKINNVIAPDIKILDEREASAINNNNLCQVGDVRKLISKLDDNSIDLVITSPPYLNSRDYTDIYIIELWILDLIQDYDALRELRFETLRSHVQVPMHGLNTLPIKELEDVISKLQENKKDHWSPSLCGMIQGYFLDIDLLFVNLKRKLKSNSKIYFNVANSAYYGVEIKVDEIVASIAEMHGFTVSEIRVARYLNPSGQQKDLINSLRESVLVINS